MRNGFRCQVSGVRTQGVIRQVFTLLKPETRHLVSQERQWRIINEILDSAGAGVLVAGFAVLTGMAADGAAGALPVDAAAAAAMAKGEAAVRKGLDWLKAQQAANGSWSDEQYPGHDGIRAVGVQP